MRDDENPLSVYFDLLDKYISEGCDVTKAMILANNQMESAQRARRVFPQDVFQETMKDIEYLIRRRPDFNKYDVAFA